MPKPLKKEAPRQEGNPDRATTKAPAPRGGNSRRNARLLRAVARLYGPLLARTSTLENVAEMVLAEAREITTSKCGFVSTIDLRTGDNICHTLTASMVSGQCNIGPGQRKVIFSRDRTGKFPGLWGHALNTRRGFFTNEPSSHPASAGVPHGHVPIRRFLSVPVSLEGEAVGQIALANPRRDYSESDLKAVQALGDCFALGIQRLRFEQALQEERDFATAVLSTAGALVVVVDVGGRILQFNRACEQTTGYQFEEVEGRAVWDFLLPPEDVRPIKAAFTRLSRSQFPIDKESDWVTRTGERRRIAWSNSCLVDSAGRVLYVISTGMDVTEKRRAEEARRESDEQRRLALEAGNLGTWNYNCVTGEVFWDERCRDLFGVSRAGQIDYALVIGIIHEADRAAVDQAVKAALAGDSAGAYATEYRVVWPDGSVHWVAANGQAYFSEGGIGREPLRLVGTVRDVTEQRLRERTLAFLAGCAPVPGDSFFQGLARFLAEIVGSDYVCIDRLDGAGLSATTLAVFHDGTVRANLSYTLKDTPCGHLLEKKVCCFPWGVRYQFPNDMALQELQAESYIGVTLWGHTGQPIGLIALIGRRPLTDPRSAEGVLSLVAARAAGELERQQAEEAVRSSEEQLRLVLEQSNDAIFWADPDTGMLVRANRKAEELTERSQEELLGMHQSQLHPADKDYRAVFREAAGALLAENIEAELLSLTGNRIPVLINSSVVEIGKRRIIQGVFRDIRARKEMEEKLRLSQEDLNRAQAVAHVGSWRLNIRSNELEWSEENWRIFGIPKGTPLTYEAFLGTVHPEDRAYVDQQWQAALWGAPYDIEHRVVAGDTVKWVRERAVLEFDSEGELVGGFGTTQDITEKKQIEAALEKAHAELEEKVQERTAQLHELNAQLQQEINQHREAENRIKEAEFRYRTVADFTYDWEYWRSPQGNLVYCSPSCHRITGYTAEELMANPQLLPRIILPEDRPVWDAHEAAALSRSGVCSIEFRIRHRHGDVRWIDHNCRAITGPSGEFLGIRASNRDISERKSGEMEMQNLRDELNRFSRIAVAGQLTAAIAHELNQPLGAIMCNAQAARNWLGRHPVNSAAACEALDEIQGDSRRAGAVIQRLRALYQKGERDFVSLQFNQLLLETLDLLHSEFVFKHVETALDLDPDLTPIKGHAVELQQVVINLLINALEAMASREGGSRLLQIRTWRESPGTVRASISDSGSGFSAEQLARLFEPFFTTKTAGMGMGLTISQSIMEEHSGQIWAANNPGGGAVFHLALPAIPENTK